MNGIANCALLANSRMAVPVVYGRRVRFPDQHVRPEERRTTMIGFYRMLAKEMIASG